MLRSPIKRLELEIRDCEARVRLHDTRLHHSLHALRDGAVQLAASKTVLAGGALLGGALGLWWSSRRRPQGHRGRWHDDDEHEERRARRDRRRHREAMPDRLERWAPLLLPLLTPLLDRKVALTLHRLGVPVNVRPTDPLPTVASLDLARYAGRWHEIARLPTRHEKDCSRDVTAEYTPDPQKGVVVVRNRCVREDGQVQEAEGLLRIPDGRRPGEAEVSFAPSFLHWWPGAWADYWVLFVDDDYQVALVGTPERDGLWILARKPSMEAADLEALKSLALRHGFDTTRLVATPHGGGNGDGAPGA
jgi:apolipoprotein D and lipocalin family protein